MKREKMQTIWQIEDEEEFRKEMEYVFRRNLPTEGYAYALQYYIGQHMDEFSLDFLREMKERVDWEVVFESICFNGLKDHIDNKVCKEFFGEIRKWN